MRSLATNRLSTNLKTPMTMRIGAILLWLALTVSAASAGKIQTGSFSDSFRSFDYPAVLSSRTDLGFVRLFAAGQPSEPASDAILTSGVLSAEPPQWHITGIQSGFAVSAAPCLQCRFSRPLSRASPHF